MIIHLYASNPTNYNRYTVSENEISGSYCCQMTWPMSMTVGGACLESSITLPHVHQ